MEGLLPWQIEKIKQLPPPPPKKTPEQYKQARAAKISAVPAKGKVIGSQPKNTQVIEMPNPVVDMKLLVERMINTKQSLGGLARHFSGCASVYKTLNDPRLKLIKTRVYTDHEAFFTEAIRLIKFLENQTLLFKNQVNALIYDPEDMKHDVVVRELLKPATNHLKLPEVDLSEV